MLEPESRGCDNPVVVKDHIQRVLLTAQTISLTTVSIDLRINVHLHLFVKS